MTFRPPPGAAQSSEVCLPIGNEGSFRSLYFLFPLSVEHWLSTTMLGEQSDVVLPGFYDFDAYPVEVARSKHNREPSRSVEESSLGKSWSGPQPAPENASQIVRTRHLRLTDSQSLRNTVIPDLGHCHAGYRGTIH